MVAIRIRLIYQLANTDFSQKTVSTKVNHFLHCMMLVKISCNLTGSQNISKAFTSVTDVADRVC